jgi:Mg-chelatase subunit ChlD
MSSYGLRILDSSGNIRLDASARIMRIIHTVYVAADVSGSIDLPGFSNATGVAFACLVPAYMNKHTVSVVGSTVLWTPASSVSGASIIMVISYA